MMIRIDDDLWLDAACVVSVEVACVVSAEVALSVEEVRIPPTKLTHCGVQIVWREHAKQCGCKMIVTEGADAARALVAALIARINAARGQDRDPVAICADPVAVDPERPLFEGRAFEGRAATLHTTGSKALVEYERLSLELHTLVIVNGGDNTGPEALAIRAQMDTAWALLSYDEQHEAEQYTSRLRERLRRV